MLLAQEQYIDWIMNFGGFGVLSLFFWWILSKGYPAMREDHRRAMNEQESRFLANISTQGEQFTHALSEQSTRYGEWRASAEATVNRTANSLDRLSDTTEVLHRAIKDLPEHLDRRIKEAIATERENICKLSDSDPNKDAVK